MLMTTRVRALQWILVVALAASTVACGSSMSATGPSGSSGSGAVISGRVNVGSSAALSSAQFPLAVVVAVPLANSSSTTVTVSIVGSDIQSTVDGNGNFTLTNVPGGTVSLRFQGKGSDATLTIMGVEPDDRLQISVTLNGNNARLDSRQSSGNGRGVEVNGRIDSIDAGARTLRVGSQSVLVQQSTSIRHGNRTFAFSDLRVGDHIQVKGARDGTTLVASEIKVETGDDDDDGDDDRDDNDVRGTISNLTGTCPVLTFFLGSTKVTTTASTKFEDGGCSTLRNDLRVEVEGSRANDGSLVASKVERD
jgi:hypothetical protein